MQRDERIKTKFMREALDRAETARLTSREACTVLASLRAFQTMRHWNLLGKTEHFENVTPLNEDEIDALCERITLDWLPQIEAREAR